MTMNADQTPSRAALEASIDHWLEQAGANGLPRDVLLDVFESMLHRLWTRAGATVGPVSMTSHADEALRRLAARYPVFAPLELGPDGRLQALVLRQNAATLHHVKLVEGLRYLLAEFLSLLGPAAGGALTDGELDEAVDQAGEIRGFQDVDDDRGQSAQPHRFNANLRPGLRTNASDAGSAWIQA